MITKFEFVKGSIYEDQDGKMFVVSSFNERKEEVCVLGIADNVDRICGYTEAVAEEMTKRFMVCVYKPCCCTC